MPTINCPNCNTHFEIEPEFLGRQVGCVKCRSVYILSEQYHDEKQKRFVIVSIVLISLIVIGVFAKIENDYLFVRKSLRFVKKTVAKKYDERFGEKDTPDGLLFFDFDKAYGNKDAKLNRTGPIVLPEHKGRVVKWSGEIAQIVAVRDHPYGSFFVKFKQSDASISDVTVYFRDDQVESLEKLQVGHYANFQGVIVSAAYGNTNHILRRGTILE